MRKISGKFLLSPWAVLIGAVAGALVGIYGKALVPSLQPLGELYLSLLQMCVIPIMVSAVIVSIGKLVRSAEAGRYLAKTITVFLLLFLTVSALSIVVGGGLRALAATDRSAKRAIGRIMVEGRDVSHASAVIREIDSRFPERGPQNSYGFLDFLFGIVPKNIFSALANGENLKIIFFCILIGVMLKFIAGKSSDTIMLALEGIYQAFLKVIGIAMYFLPFAIGILTAEQFSGSGLLMLGAFLKLIAAVFLASSLVLLVSSLIIWKMTGGSYFRQFKALGEAIFICLGACNSLAAIPSGITGLAKELKLNEDRVNLSLPLGVTLCRYGVLVLFTVTTFFAAQLYNYSFTPLSILLVCVTSIIAAVTTSGAPYLVAISLIGIIMTPLGLPAETVIVVLIAIGPLVDGILSLANFYPVCAAAAVIARENN